MAVQVERHADRRMPKTFLSHFRMSAGQQKLRRVAVAEIMEPDPGDVLYAPDESGEFVGQAPRLHRLAVNAGAEQRVTILPNPELQELLGLFPFQAAQLVDRKGRQGNR